MVKVDTKHILSDKEVYTLRQLIGKTLVDIHSSRVDMNIKPNLINVLDPINLIFKETGDFIVISAEFDETNFGEDFFKINIEQSSDLIGVKRSEQLGLKMPPLNMDVLPEFKISKIEVYGRSYFCESDNMDPKPYWQIEIDNPRQKIIENIDTENTLLFYSESRRLLIKPHRPWVIITFNKELIDELLIDKNIDGNQIAIMKHQI